MALVAQPFQQIRFAAAALTAMVSNVCTQKSPGSFPAGSLLFQMEADESKQPSSKHGLSSSLQCVKERIAFFSTPCNAFCQRLLRDVRCFSKALLRESNEVDTVELASKLSRVGYSVTVRNALGGGGGSCFRNLRHEFLLIRSAAQDDVEYIIDLHFREQFEIPQPTDEYLAVLSSAPEHFVGQLGRLMPVVQALCTEMAASFKAKGLELPPWRKTQSMLSKWMPNKSRDVSFSEPGTPCASRTTSLAVPGFDRISADAVVQTVVSPVKANTGAKKGLLLDSQQQQQQQQHTVIGFDV